MSVRGRKWVRELRHQQAAEIEALRERFRLLTAEPTPVILDSPEPTPQPAPGADNGYQD